MQAQSWQTEKCARRPRAEGSMALIVTENPRCSNDGHHGPRLGNGRPAGGRVLLFDLGNQRVADHDLRHPLGEFEDIVPHPVSRFLIGGKCLVRAVKYADGDQHIGTAIKR